MRQHLQKLTIRTPGQGLIDITARVDRVVTASGLDRGLICLQCLHTSASLCVNENADPRVLADLSSYLQAIAPQGGVRALDAAGTWRGYTHNDEGPDDMPAHVRTLLTNTSLTLSFDAGQLLLGTWQGIYLIEHRSDARSRTIVVHCWGEQADTTGIRHQ